MITGQTLREAGRYPKVPFTIELADAKSDLKCIRILRLLPNKRMVVKGTFHNEPVIAKIFFSLFKSRQSAQAEMQGMHTLSKAGILTPKILYRGPDKAKTMHVLILEKLDPNIDLDKLWHENKNPQAFVDYLKMMTQTLAKQHEGGLIQYDVHAKNYIPTDRGIYHIDGSDIEATERLLPVRKEKSFDNLGKFFALLPPAYDDLLPELVEIYRKERHWPKISVDTKDIIKLQQEHRKQRDRRKLKKIFRESTQFYFEKNLNHMLIIDRRYDTNPMKTMLENIDVAIANAEILKAGNTCTVAKVEINMQPFVIKRYNIKSIFHLIKRLFQVSRAAKCWRNSHRLLNYGFKTPTPIAIYEQRFGILKGKSYFITEYVEGKKLDEYLNSVAIGVAEKTEIVKKMVDCLKLLTRVKLVHGDLKASNFIVTDKGIYLTDLDSMRYYSNNQQLNDATQKDRQRFLENWSENFKVLPLFQDSLEELQ